MKLISTTLLLVSLSCVVAGDTEKKWSVTSPDKTLFACVRRIPDPDLVHRLDLDGLRLVIFRLHPNDSLDNTHDVYAKREFPHRIVAHIQWSPDSKFLVFTTTSSGGHSPWHYNAFVFCVADKSFRYMDDTIGSVVAPDFRFEPPDVAIMTIPDRTAENEPMKTQQRKIPLAKTFQQAKPAK
jgi:hypothetical protein